jgi:regulator of ribonuclease activity A
MTISTPDLCDAHPDDVRVLEPLLQPFGGREAFGGEIVTIKCFEDNSLVKQLAAKPGHGRVMVVDGGGSLRRALLGDMIAANAADNGWAGLIIYGAVRDVEALRDIELGVMAMAPIPVKTDKRGLGDLDVPVTFGGVTFHPGEFAYADDNGVICAAHALT